MPGLKDLLKKKDKIADEQHDYQLERDNRAGDSLAPPEFKFIRSTTESEEIIQPPTYSDDDSHEQPRTSKEKKRMLGFRNSSNFSFTKDSLATNLPAAAERSSRELPVRPKGERRLSDRFHLHRRDRSRSGSVESSTNLPQDLPEAPEAVSARPKSQLVRGRSYTDADVAEQEKDKAANEEQEAKWEKRATILAMNSPLRDGHNQSDRRGSNGRSRSKSPSISNSKGDVNIQEAIRLHEAGDLKWSTEMFGALANPKGQNNALAQVLYGLALRHGWGVPVETEKAIHYLQLAASNSASIEHQALESGMKKGGAAKGELVLAIFELGNSFRHGWGVKKDAVAARQYYETAANLGDTDAMEEAAWCYLEGFGGPKDKFKAAQYLRLAEEKGSKGVGNSWIWKEKYNAK